MLSRWGVALRLCVLAAFLISGIFHVANVSAALYAASGQSEQIQRADFDDPCDRNPATCEHRTDRACASGNGCPFAVLMPEVQMLPINAKPATWGLVPPSLQVDARIFLFRPPRPSTQP